MMKLLRPIMDGIKRIKINPTKQRVDPKLFTVTRPENLEPDKLLNAIPYYLLAYGNNIELLAPLVKQPILSMIILGLAKALKAAGKHYKIKQEKLIK